VLLTFHSVLLLAMASLDLLLALYCAARLLANRGGWAFLGLMASIIAYSLGHALQVVDPDPSKSSYWTHAQQIGLTAFPAFFGLLALRTTHSAWAQSLVFRLILFAPVFLLLPAYGLGCFLQCHPAQNPVVHYVAGYIAGTRWHAVRDLYAVAYLSLAALRLLTQLSGSQRSHRNQTLLMLLAAMAPSALYLAALADRQSIWTSPTSPLLFNISSLLFAYSIFGNRFLDYNPIARELVFDRMLEAVILLDPHLRIIDFNNAATHIFPELEQHLLGEKLDHLYPHAPGLQELVTDCSDHGCELPETARGHTYEAHIQQLHLHGLLLGRMLRFNDVSRQVELRRDLERMATTDALTGVQNRGHLLTSLHREIKRAARLRSPLAILFLDLDLFKRINDTYGHSTGDDILQLFARTIQKNMRSTDLFGRYGGEEFLFVLTGTTQEQAQQVAEKVRKAIAALSHPVDSALISITTSIGIATYDNFDEHPSSDALIQRADAALYQAKAQGRNRVICWDAIEKGKLRQESGATV
jgi:diguanylate cyclase (GGDEF)-like protein